MPRDHLHFIWPQARPFIGRALARDAAGRYELVDILDLLLAGKGKLWVSWDGKVVEAAIVTETVDYPRLRELRIWLVGGRNMKAWVVEARDMIEEYARAEGCAIVSGGMRRGWIRIGGPGWHETGVAFEKRF